MTKEEQLLKAVVEKNKGSLENSQDTMDFNPKTGILEALNSDQSSPVFKPLNKDLSLEGENDLDEADLNETPFDATSDMPNLPLEENTPIRNISEVSSKNIPKVESTDDSDQYARTSGFGGIWDLVTNKPLKYESDSELSKHENKLEEERLNAVQQKKRSLLIANLMEAMGDITSGYAGMGGAGAVFDNKIDTSGIKAMGNLPMESYKEAAKLYSDRMKDKESKNWRQEESRANRELRKLTAMNTLMLRKEEMNKREDEQTTKKIENFSKRIENSTVPSQIQSLNKIEEIMQKSGGSIYNPPEDIPGLGMGKSMIPDWILSDEGVEVRQNVSALANELLKSRSGASVTDQEFKRFLREASTGNFSRTKDTTKWIKKMAEQVELNAKNLEAYDPTIKEKYKEYSGGNLPSENMNFKPEGKVRTESLDKVKLLAPNGKTILVPKEQVDEAIKKGARKL